MKLASLSTAFVASVAPLEEANKVIGHALVSSYVEVGTERLEASVLRLSDALDMEVS